jgi:predicted nuclease of predicted toxin-antitoxin system
MRFIVDTQLPKRLCQLLASFGADCVHTLDLPMKNKTEDHAIIQIANEESRIIITKDLDFLQSHLLFYKPEKLLLVSTGNIHNNLLLKIFEKNYSMLINLFEHKSLITMTKEEIIVHG